MCIRDRPKIKQYSIQSTGSQKLRDLVTILKARPFLRAMIFCNTKYTTARLCEQLGGFGFSCDSLHGDKTQQDRNKIMAAFRDGGFQILVATDVAARGIDISDVDVVISYEVPLENEYYLHRIGRTGRAKREGTSYVFYSLDEAKHLKEIIKYTRSEVIPLTVTEQGELIEGGQPDAQEV